MPAYYRAPLEKFINESELSIIGTLALANQEARFQLSPEAVEAWELQLSPLVLGCRHMISELPNAAKFEILLEYPIPRLGKRIDAVLLMHNVIVVIETKTGLSATTA